MFKFISKPEIIEALQFDGLNHVKIRRWMMESAGVEYFWATPPTDTTDAELYVELTSEWEPVSVTDWIVRTPENTFEVLQDSVFTNKYDLIR